MRSRRRNTVAAFGRRGASAIFGAMRAGTVTTGNSTGAPVLFVSQTSAASTASHPIPVVDRAGT